MLETLPLFSCTSGSSNGFTFKGTHASAVATSHLNTSAPNSSGLSISIDTVGNPALLSTSSNSLTSASWSPRIVKSAAAKPRR